MTVRLAPLLGRVGGALRDGWLMLGISLALFLGLEFGFRGVRAVRQAFRPAPAVPDSSLHPYAGTDWWEAFQTDDGLAARQNEYDPYRGFWAIPARSRYVNVDSLGRRVTPQPPPATANPRRVFMLGGSTMWGYTARDSFTIPAYTALALRERGITDVEVVNLAQGAFNTTQELTTLAVEMARGNVPSVAVFLDGYNDVATAVKHGEVGRTYGEESVQQQIDLGRRGFWGELVGLGRHSELVERLQEAVGITRPPPKVRGHPEEICGAVGGYFRRVAIEAEALGRARGFPTYYFLQPVNATSGKPRSGWEKILYEGKAVRPCMTSIDSAMSDRVGHGYESLTGLFDADTGTVFVDEHAHITEAANRRVAERIAEVIAPLLRTPVSPPAAR